MQIVHKLLKYSIIGILLLITIIVAGSALITAAYEKAIVRYVRGYLDEHLLTQLSMNEDIRFRFLKGFPNTTAEINNVLLLSGAGFSQNDFNGRYSDTLLHAGTVYFQFNLLKMLKKEFELRKIEISDGTLNILFDKSRKNNLKIWKASLPDSNRYELNLRNIILNRTHVRIVLMADNFNLDAYSVRTHFKGNLNTSLLSGETKGQIQIENLMSDRKTLVSNSSLQVDIDMMYSNGLFKISQGEAKLNKAIANISGIYNGKSRTIDLVIDIPKFGLDELMSIIPGEKSLSSGDYEFSGNGILHLAVKGPLSGKNLTAISDFMLSNCTARNKATKTSLTNLSLKGTLSGSTAANSRLRVDTFYAKLGKGTINGRFAMNDLNTLMFQSDIHAHLNLKTFTDFTGIDAVEMMAGNIRADFNASGSLKDFSPDSSEILVDFIKRGIFYLEDAGIRLKGSHLTIENVTGKAVLRESLELDSVSARINGTGLLVSGELHNLRQYLLRKGELKSSLQINADIIDINKFLIKERSETGQRSHKVFPERIYLKGQITSKEFIAGKFRAEEVYADFSAGRDSIYLGRVGMKFPDGSISGKALIRTEPGKRYSVTCIAGPQKINIQHLFYTFNNFTQNFIVDKNLKGQVEGNISFFAQWDSASKFIPASMQAKGDFRIINGELIQFEPMLKLSKYIDVDELQHIRFKTLTNSIYISDRVIRIPEMDINSSAFNISVAGQHTFDNQFDYRVRVLLSEVLFKKARKKKKKEIDEFLVEETRSDQTTLPFIIAGSPDQFDVKFDRKAAFRLTLSKDKESPAPYLASPDNIKLDWEEPEGRKATKPKQVKKEQPEIVIEWDE